MYMWDITKIWRGLYQGAAPPPGHLVRTKGFDVLVLTAKENQDPSIYQDVIVITAPGDDDDRPHRFKRFRPAWEAAALEVARHVKEGRKVLVTCMQGLNRSGFVTAMALHHITGWPGATCVEHVQGRRQYALCNPTFARYIAENVKAKE